MRVSQSLYMSVMLHFSTVFCHKLVSQVISKFCFHLHYVTGRGDISLYKQCMSFFFQTVIKSSIKYVLEPIFMFKFLCPDLRKS